MEVDSVIQNLRYRRKKKWGRRGECNMWREVGGGGGGGGGVFV